METIQKSWGWEYWFANSKLYCGKLIFIRSGSWSSDGLYHYHEKKDETFFVIDGSLVLEYYEGSIHRSITLNQNDSFHIFPGIKHRFMAQSDKGCKFIETSTEHFESDSYRGKFIDGQWCMEM